jgi:hypothetical protein
MLGSKMRMKLIRKLVKKEEEEKSFHRNLKEFVSHRGLAFKLTNNNNSSSTNIFLVSREANTCSTIFFCE